MAQENLHLDIVSPEKKLFTGEVTSVTLPGIAGSFSILRHHAPIISSLKKGTITFVTGGNEQTIDIQGGFVEFSDELVSVCVS
ncbi:ATP synthase epsilon chain [termite gut metagenome]|uniref:ATP synthase epsilon chain n=1 Tax=termite gut metagenome TaxID=433724 RepID=A0A5J4SCR6_9ZZZZ